MAVTVTEATEATPELLAAFGLLIPQLSTSARPLELAELAEMVESPASIVLIARSEDGPIVGSLTLAVFRIPTGLRAWIDDVVVDEEARGQGVGRALIRAAIDDARARGCRNVDLTSRPARERANRLYRELGFVRRDTNVYRYDLV